MTSLSSAREALIAETLGEVVTLIREVEALATRLDGNQRAIAEASSGLAAQLATCQSHLVSVTDLTKVQAVKHIAVRTDEAARRSIELQRQAMETAARAAIGDEVGAALRRLQAAMQAVIERRGGHWEAWLTHLAASATASAATWTLSIWLWHR